MDERHLAIEASNPKEDKAIGTAEPRERGDKIPFFCPGCARALRIRPSYLGSKVVCKRCNHQFVAEPAGGALDRARRPRQGIPDGGRHRGDRVEADLPLLETQLDEARLKIEALDVAASARAAEQEESKGELARLAAMLAVACERLAAVGSEVEQSRLERESLEARTGRVLIAELEARLAEERNLAERRLGPVEDQFAEFKRKSSELTEANLAAEQRSLACHERLESIERTLPQPAEALEWIRGEIASLWAADEDRTSGRSQLEAIRAESRTHLEAGAAWDEEVRAQLEALLSRQGSIEARLTEQGDRQAKVESEVLRLETTGLRHRQELEAQWERFETQSLARWQAIEDIYERLREAGNLQDARQDQLESFLERIEALEADASSFRIGTDSARVDHSRMLEGGPRQVAGLPGSTIADRGPRSIVATSPRDFGIAAAPGQTEGKTLAGIDQLVDELACEQVDAATSGGPVGRSDDDNVYGHISVRAIAAPSPDEPNAIDAGRQIENAKQKFDESMRSLKFAEAAKEARELVRLTCQGDATPDLTHALWLRNLGLSLSMAGELVEASASFHAALEICGPGEGPAWSPRLVCLLDLAEFYLHTKDAPQALRFCELALAMLEVAAMPANAFWDRARRCLERIKAAEGPMSLLSGIRPEATVAILT